MSNYQFEFTLEDATQEQAELLLEMICTWADHHNCWIAGGYHRASPSPCQGEGEGERSSPFPPGEGPGVREVPDG